MIIEQYIMIDFSRFLLLDQVDGLDFCFSKVFLLKMGKFGNKEISYFVFIQFNKYSLLCVSFKNVKVRKLSFVFFRSMFFSSKEIYILSSILEVFYRNEMMFFFQFQEVV